MKLIKQLILTITLLSIYSCTLDYYAKPKVTYETRYNNLYNQLKLEHKWLNQSIYNKISKNLNLYNITDNDEKLYLMNTLVWLIDKESLHGTRFTGILCKVYLHRNGIEVIEYHRARGYMQVMIYNTTLTDEEEYKLYDLDINLYWGIKTFMRGYIRANRNIEITLKNYNSGENSDYFNWDYINYIIDNSNKFSL